MRHFRQIAIVLLPSEKFQSLDMLCKKCLLAAAAAAAVMCLYADVAVVAMAMVVCGLSVFIGKCVRVYDVVKMAFSCPLLVDCLDEMPKI